MSKMLVVVFDDEKNAYKGAKELAELHWDGSISVYAGAVIARDADGNVSIKDDVSEGPVGTALGMLTGALIGMFAGPEGLVVGAAVGGMTGSIADLINLGVGSDFLDEVAAQLQPGKYAVVAEIEEYWSAPVDSAMAPLGGEIHRRFRADVEDDQIDRDIAAARQDWNDLTEEIKTANEENKAKLEAKAEAAKAKLADAVSRAKAKAAAVEKEGQDKIAALKKQIEKANAKNKAKIEAQKEKIKADYDARVVKLKASLQKAQHAIAA